jgi:hypothetical protein
MKNMGETKIVSRKTKESIKTALAMTIAYGIALMMGGAKHQYLWHVCGFVSIIICMEVGQSSANVFNVAMLCAQETGLGVLVYKALGGGWEIRGNRDPVEFLPADMKEEMRQRTRAWQGVLL